MAKKTVYAAYNPSQSGPKNQGKPLESQSSEALYMMHTQYKDKERQEHNGPEDYQKWIAIVEILSQRGKMKNPQNMISELRGKIKKPSLLSRLFGKTS